MADDTFRVSWSSLTRYESCPQKWLRTKQGNASPVVDGRNFLQGSVVDRAMRKWLEQETFESGAMLTYVDEFLDHFVDEDPQYIIKWRGNKKDDFAKVRKFCRSAVTNLEPLLQQYVLPFDYQPARRFNVDIIIPGLDGNPRTVTLIGEYDLQVRDDDKNWHVYDLKATANDKYVQGKTLAQLTFYSISIAAEYKDNTQPSTVAFLTPMCKQKYVPVEVTLENKRELLSRVVQYAHSVWKEDFLPVPGNHCYDCSVKHACDYWAPKTSTSPDGKTKVSLKLSATRRKEMDNER